MFPESAQADPRRVTCDGRPNQADLQDGIEFGKKFMGESHGAQLSIFE